MSDSVTPIFMAALASIALSLMTIASRLGTIAARLGQIRDRMPPSPPDPS